MILHNVAQGSSEWSALRRGVPTASEFDALITPLWEVRKGAQPYTYVVRKLCEKLVGFSSADSAGSWAMDQGVILEKEALPWFEFTHGIAVDRVGFCTTDDGRIGCSPDGLIGDEGGIEMKCPQPEAHLKYLLGGVVPPDYAAQVQGSMYVTGRKWWYFVSYSRLFPSLVLKVQRDEYAQEQIEKALKGFLDTFDRHYTKLKAQRDAEDAAKEAAYHARSRD